MKNSEGLKAAGWVTLIVAVMYQVMSSIFNGVLMEPYAVFLLAISLTCFAVAKVRSHPRYPSSRDNDLP